MSIIFVFPFDDAVDIFCFPSLRTHVDEDLVFLFFNHGLRISMKFDSLILDLEVGFFPHFTIFYEHQVVKDHIS